MYDSTKQREPGVPQNEIGGGEVEFKNQVSVTDDLLHAVIVSILKMSLSCSCVHTQHNTMESPVLGDVQIRPSG